MHLVEIRVENFKSFRDSGWVSLAPGVNVVVGQNDAGKSALIDALGFRADDTPHRSLASMPDRNTRLPHASVTTFRADLTAAEVRAAIDSQEMLAVPLTDQTEAAQGRELVQQAVATGVRVMFKVVSRQVQTAWLEPIAQAESRGWADWFALVQYDRASGDVVLHSTRQAGAQPGLILPARLAAVVQSRVYAFRAERMNVGRSGMGDPGGLAVDASNLPQVLHHLQTGNPSAFARYQRAVRTVFPHITQITIPPESEKEASILLWTVDPETERDDLAIALLQSGTGISQVLAMLFVVLSASAGQTIVIDEPQSFLHPGAFRKLLSIFKDNPRHQYVLTTHSPIPIAAADVATMKIIRRRESESVIENVDLSERRHLEAVLAEVGARLSDVFGADNVLWVEGATEELCFPLIAAKLLRRPLYGTVILGVQHTGDFERKRARTAIQLYERLSASSSLMPPAVGFIFDSEGRSEAEKADLEARSRGAVSFLPRRMYENYLLNASAISAILGALDEGRENALEPSAVEDWLKKHGGDPQFFPKGSQPVAYMAEGWARAVHGANLLDHVLSGLSEKRVVYEKTRDAPALTAWVLEHARSDLEDVAAMLDQRLGSRPAM